MPAACCALGTSRIDHAPARGRQGGSTDGRGALAWGGAPWLCRGPHGRSRTPTELGLGQSPLPIGLHAGVVSRLRQLAAHTLYRTRHGQRYPAACAAAVRMDGSCQQPASRSLRDSTALTPESTARAGDLSPPISSVKGSAVIPCLLYICGEGFKLCRAFTIESISVIHSLCCLSTERRNVLKVRQAGGRKDAPGIFPHIYIAKDSRGNLFAPASAHPLRCRAAPSRSRSVRRH